MRPRHYVFLFIDEKPPRLKGLSGNNLVNLPWSFVAQLRSSLVTDPEGYAPHSRLAAQQNPGDILPNLFPDRL
jgi:hypothetical protein